MLIGSTPVSRHCPVTADTLDRDAKQRATRHKRSLAAEHQARRRPGVHVQRHRRLRLRRLQHTGLKHRFRAREAFLVGLEDELHRALEFALMRLEQLCRTQQHRGMHIVSAGVHAAVFRTERQVGLLPHLERVHVGTQQDTAPHVFARELRDHAAAQLARLIAEQSQLFFDKLNRLRQVRADLRRAVDRSPVLDDLVFHFDGFRQ